MGEQGRIVGYTAVDAAAPGAGKFTGSEQAFLLELARWSVKLSAANQELSEITSANVPPRLDEKWACFVTLTKDSKLRGCIGQLTASEPVYQAVIKNARNAAIRDPRFPVVEPGEVDKIKIEISVLTEPQRLEFNSPEDLLAKLHPKQTASFCESVLAARLSCRKCGRMFPGRWSF